MFRTFHRLIDLTGPVPDILRLDRAFADNALVDDKSRIARQVTAPGLSLAHLDRAVVTRNGRIAESD